MNKLALALIPILAVVFVSGCTIGGGGTGAVTSNDGITINSFSATPTSDVLSGDDVLFELEIENTGGTTARNTRVELYGVDSQWREPNDDLVDSTLPKEFGTLDPPIVGRNVAGDFRLHQWQIKTPAIGQGITAPVPVTARVTYDYNTSGFLQITTVTEDEFQRMRITGETVPAPVVQNSFGPIQLNVPTTDKLQYMVIDTKGGESEAVYPFRISFINTGSGFPVTEELGGGNFIGAGGRLSGSIKLLGRGVEFEDCLGTSSGTEINLDDVDILPRIKENQRAEVGCSVKFNLDEWGDRPKDTIMFLFNIFYTYYTEETVYVNIIGR